MDIIEKVRDLARRQIVPRGDTSIAPDILRAEATENHGSVNASSLHALATNGKRNTEEAISVIF